MDIPGAVEVSLDELLDIRGSATYLLRVDGDRMLGSGIFSGDLLVVSKAMDPVRGAVVIAALNGEPVCKRLDYAGDMPVLRSDNPKFADRYIFEGDEFSIWGVVTHSVRAHPTRKESL